MHAAVRDLGIDRTEAQRAVKRSRLSEEAKQARWGQAHMVTQREVKPLELA
jgi:hypothetical protein